MTKPYIDINDYDELLLKPADLIPVNTQGENSSLNAIHSTYPIRITRYYYNLIDKNNISNDPIYLQCMPSTNELQKKSFIKEDGLGEQQDMPVNKLIHRYPDRIVLLATNQCPMFCRFCFRKRLWKHDCSTYLKKEELSAAITYLKQHPEISEVLLSGGDPLMLNNEYLHAILEKLSAIESIQTLRIGSRLPVTLPQRIDDDLILLLKKIPSLWLVTHFNHPREITKASITACSKFINAGIPVLNQTVLLKGVNDNTATLEELFKGLVRIKVNPHYLFHIDPIEGAAHFATGIRQGLKIMKSLRERLSSLCLPTFAIDLPNGGGKIPLLPNYQDKNGRFSTLDNNYIDYPFNDL